MSIQAVNTGKFQKAVASAVPYSQQISPTSVITYEGDLTETIQLLGIPFETIGNKDLDASSTTWFANLTTMMRDGGLAFWTHIVRRRISYDMAKIGYDNYFSTEFAKQYAAKFNAEPQFHNELFISPVVRMGSSDLDRWGAKLSRKNSETMQGMREDAKERLGQVTAKLMTDLRRYHPRILGTYEQADVTCTELGGFYSRLLNAKSSHVPLAQQELSYGIQSADLHFGHEVVEIAGATGSRYAAALGLVAPYTVEAADVKVFETLLALPVEFVLSQSVTTLPYAKADNLLERQTNVIKSTSNNEAQIKNIGAARTNLQNGKFQLLEHEFILIVYGDSPKALNANINTVVSALDEKVVGTSRLTGGTLIASYFNILPANFRVGRTRAMTISSENFVKFFPMHNFSIGNARGSQWGMPVCMLKTSGRSPYFFNYHVSKSALREQGVELEYEDTDEHGHRKEVGHYRILGRTGDGKTVIRMALQALARKKNNKGSRPLKTFSFDLHRGEELPIRAMGGKYHRFEQGVASGLNPFTLPNTSDSHMVIFRTAAWAAQCGGGFRLWPADEQVLFKAIRLVYELDPRDRRFARVLDNIPDTGKEGLKAVLQRWVEGGPYAWVLDSPQDKFDLSSANDWGFDITSFIEIDEARQPILMLLTHMMSLAANGSPHIIHIAEAWRSLKDPMMLKYIEDKVLTARRKDGVIGLDTQEPEHLTDSALGSTLVSQFQTQILLPNPMATPEGYIEGLKCTPREFHLIKTTPVGIGKFLVKKGIESNLVSMDLSGMSDMLALLSTSSDNLEVAEEVWKHFGDDPAIWVPEFLKRRV